MNFTAGRRRRRGRPRHGCPRCWRSIPQAVVVLVTAHSDVELAVEAMKKGAADFVTKPWENERLLATLMAGAQSAPLAPGSGGTAPAQSRPGRRHPHRIRHDRHLARHAAGVRRHPPHRAHRCQCADPGRERHRQGTGGARNPSPVAARQRGLPAGGYGRAVAAAFRKRAVRPSPRRLHRRQAGSHRAISAPPPAARCSWTRSAMCRCICKASC